MKDNSKGKVKKQPRRQPADTSGEYELTAVSRRESEEKFRSLVRYIPDVIWTSDKDQRIIFLSQNVKAVTGYTQEEEYHLDKRTRWWDRIHPEDAPKYKAAYKELTEKQKSFNIIYRFKHKDGRWMWIYDRAISAYEKDGTKYAHGLLTDISEHKAAEAQIKALKEKYESVIRNIPYTIYSGLPNENCEIVFISVRYEDWTGYSPQDFYRDPGLWPKTIHPADRERAVRTYMESYEKGKAYLSEYRVVHKDTGQIRWVRDHGVPVWDEKGKLLLFDGVVIDVTESKEMEVALQKSEEFSSELLENSPNPIIVINSDGSIRYVSPTLERVTGYSSAELLGTKPPYPWRTNDSAGEGRVSAATASGNIAEAESLLRDKSGKQFWVRESTVEVVNRDGSKYLLVNWVDTTEQKRLRDNMQFYIRETTIAQEQERKRLSWELHDETAQSLADLCTDIDETMMKEQLSERVILRLQRLRNKVDNMLDEVRRFSHELRPGLLDEFGLIPSLELLTQEMSHPEKLECHININGTKQRLSPEAETILFRITQEALRNVRKHSAATEAVVNVEFRDGHIKLDITDNGVGFIVPNIMGSFARRGKLGIMGMQERASLLNGSLTVTSGKDRGTTITADIPL